jgi:tetratricopeptide (TPR) repeat protein
LVIGRGYFYKKQYYEAIDNFQYVYSRFKDQPTAPMALIWAANAYLGANQNSSALSALETAKSLKSLTEKQKSFLFATYAAYSMKEGNYDEAAKSLEKCFKLKLTKYERSRYNFLMGQLLMASGKNAKAKPYFLAALKGNPPYDLEFNAKLNLIRIFEKGNDSEVRRLLTKMLKEQKNKSNYDQLYYELAQLDLKQKKNQPAFSNFQKAAWAATVNLGIKGSSYLRAAEICFSKPDYELAQLYYDSASAFLPKTHPEYERANGRKESLTEVVKLIKTIQEGDSLLKLAKLDSVQLRKEIEKGIAAEEAAAKKKAEEAKKNAENKNNGVADINPANAAPNSAWAFDNPAAKSLGFSEFKRTWGDRPNEDNWRRSKKEMELTNGSSPKIDSSNLAQNTPKDPKDNESAKETEIKNRMSAVPKNQAGIDALKQRVIEAYFSLGMIYRDRMKEDKESIKSFESLLAKYPENKYLNESWYNLYQLWTDVPNPTKATYYKNLLLKDSTSKYALLLQGKPLPEEENMEKKLEKSYQAIFAEYQAENYRKVLSETEKALRDTSSAQFTPRFELLKGLAQFKLGLPGDAEKTLTHVATTYASHPAKTYADEILMLLRRGSNTQEPAPINPNSGGGINTSLKTNLVVDTSLYKNTFNDEHFVVLAADMGQTGYVGIKLDVRLAQFNDAKFGLDNLQITSTVLANSYQAFIVRTFKDQEKAQYFSGIAESDPELLSGTQPGKNKIFAISKNNFTTLIKTGKLKEYLDYYQAYYLQK